MAFRRRSKSYPFFSQEFLIQNHADIVFCLVVLILIGLMFEATAKTAFLFILPQYNTTAFSPDGEVSFYYYGWRDCVTIFFYVLIVIILHAVVQEYVLDKASRRLHLSKSKNTKFNESGQLCVFHSVSAAWSLYILVTEGYILHLSSLWENYPHVHLRFQVKFFYLFQLAYWFHTLPELYFQKEEIPRQLTYISLYLLHITVAYLLKFDMWALSFVFTRMVILTLTVLVVGFGLARVDSQGFDWEAGNFNISPIRLAVLLIVCLTQAWLLWRFIRFQLRRWREYRREHPAHKRPAAKLPLRTLKRDTGGHHENGMIKAENGASPRTKKIKAP
ncbi:translocating chain-associated membrane protein 2-like [Scleropages formosus]|uniref:Translocating chain-associated membrane protein 2-like n=1 Tax=Scleropages formosus TaxID=113540 RepID=A0A0P7WS79_SCLFO|nr:translocating chain-associated membrane protein 2-like [Scleropages formosus]